MPGLRDQLRTAGNRLLIPPARSNKTELLDTGQHNPTELAENFRDIRRVNRLLGGTSAVLRELPPLLDPIPQDRPVTILDLATGIADIPLAIVHWTNRHGRNVQIVASDASAEILNLAARETSTIPEISLAQYDARSVPLPDRSFDIVLCSLALHHFTPDDAIAVLREMRRLATNGIILNDLYRSSPGYVAAWIAAHLTARNRMTRHDAPLSVLRAYTPGELIALLDAAGYRLPRIGKHLWFRMTAVERIPHDEV
jgi:SAM-dependent methyltransferase